jgi:hypothetical protein
VSGAKDCTVSELLVLRNHRIERFLECRRKYALLDAWEAKEMAWPPALGTLIHAGVEKWHLTGKDNEAIAYLGKAVESIRYADKMALLEAALLHLVAFFDFNRRQPLTFLATETEFSFDLFPQVRYDGRIDGLVAIKDRNFVHDTKSTALSPDWYFDLYERSPQLIGYVIAAERIYNVPIDGFVVDAIFKVTEKRLQPQFDRRIFPLIGEDAAKKEEWLNNIAAITETMRHAIDSDAFYPNYFACHGRYGVCEFWNYCKSGCDMNVLLESHTRRETANVVTATGDG